MSTKIYEKNVLDLQQQLQHAYAHIEELNKIKSAATKVVEAQTELSDFAHYNPKLMNKVDNAIWELKDSL